MDPSPTPAADAAPSTSASRGLSTGRLSPTQLWAKFNVTFALMSIIPLLICCYLLTVKFYTISILEGINGLYLFLAVFFAVLGLAAGRQTLHQILQRVVDSNKQLEQLYNQQAAFVSNVAHEFRAPLTVLKGAMDNLVDGLHGPLTSDQAEPVRMCQREANRLRRLVGDLLDIARIEAGKVRLQQEPVVLQEVLTATAQLFADSAKQRGLTLALDLPPGPVTVIGDRDRLQQVFVNLLANAVKFTGKGEIQIRLKEDGEEAQAEIEDTGPGIAAGDLERIFDKFERVGTQTEEGSGLGLPIARDLISLHHGRLWVESEVGKGSRFLVRLPANSTSHA